MREALARSDFDAVRRAPAPERTRGPASPAARARRAPQRPPSPARRTLDMAAGIAALGVTVTITVAAACLGALKRYPAALGGGIAGTAMAVAIIVNAAFLQETTHPSPLFGAGRETAAPSAPRAPAKPVPLPPAPRPAEMSLPAKASLPADTPAETTAAQPQPPRRGGAATVIDAAPAANDPIAHLLATGAPPREAKPAGAPAGVLAVQKALVKLGYAITADGLMGPATRQAIMAFEKLEGLPQTGDPANIAMRRALAVAAGMTLD
ncbi:MAG: peptidoglycan-binding domain-containing protein [Pseudochelatococcus sp.]|uniref:peptidoglycan-binding domain-containing protein n=1 Tax=Pseudochelatococcus sp. TaxID=2020869 RepID=UPI003D9159F6